MTEPRPPIYPRDGDWPEDDIAKRLVAYDPVVDFLPPSPTNKEAAAEISRLRNTILTLHNEMRDIRAELAAANERAEKAEQTLLKHPDWKQHWEHQVSRREEVQATLSGVMLERDHFHAQWQTALRELAAANERADKAVGNEMRFLEAFHAADVKTAEAHAERFMEQNFADAIYIAKGSNWQIIKSALTTAFRVAEARAAYDAIDGDYNAGVEAAEAIAEKWSRDTKDLLARKIAECILDEIRKLKKVTP